MTRRLDEPEMGSSNSSELPLRERKVNRLRRPTGLAAGRQHKSAFLAISESLAGRTLFDTD
jgi:hypothetical protein